MKKLLWSLIQKYFKVEMSQLVDSHKEKHFRELNHAQENRRIKMNYPVGTKVIVRSNEPDDLFIGEVVGYQHHEKSDKYYLIIQDKVTGQEICPLDQAPPYWTKEREAALRKLNWAEQWNVLSKYYDIDEEHQKYKESFEYENRLNS